jgi:hypothetical protein
MKNIIILVLLVLFLNELNSSTGVDKYILNPTLGFHMGVAFPIRSADYVDFYKENFNKTFKETAPNTFLGLNYKLELINQFRFGILLDYYKKDFNDVYQEQIQTINGLVNKNYSENFKVQYIPLLLSGELIPFKSQFRSFIGIALGPVFSNIEWKESVVPEIDGDLRTGGIHYQKNSINLGAKLNCGFELGFDDRKFNHFLQCLYFEFYYYYISNYGDLFSKIKSQMANKQENFNENYSIIPSYFGISVGILINTKGL